jgi:hypothetical protein
VNRPSAQRWRGLARSTDILGARCRTMAACVEQRRPTKRVFWAIVSALSRLVFDTMDALNREALKVGPTEFLSLVLKHERRTEQKSGESR